MLSDLLNVGSEDHVRNHWVWLAWLDVSSDELELPHALNPLSDALQGCDILQELVCLWWIEHELDYLLLASCHGALGVVALKVLVRGLKNENKFVTNDSKDQNPDPSYNNKRSVLGRSTNYVYETITF